MTTARDISNAANWKPLGRFGSAVIERMIPAEACKACGIYDATQDGLCADCWEAINGQFGVGA